MPDGPGLELLRGEIDTDAPGAVLATSYEKERAALIVDAARVIDVLTWLRDTPGQGYRFLSSLHVADYLPAEPRFGVHYELLNRERVERLRVKAMLPAESPEIDSCVELFPTANFQEREAFDFFGVVFHGHPELTRILLPEDYVGFPQRRDFPIGGEPVTFTYSEGRYGG
ncbi:MAG TPA: NADH-quinone oxidoreductase subunit C [Solirubrobacterales bacterium]|nr:NADH-quinone oxidoreductase subunit C [Solirubrobacterales bacterium]